MGVELTFEVLDTAQGRQLRGLVAGAEPSVVDLVAVNAKQFIATHVGVPSSLGGQGVGKKMVEFLIQHARDEGLGIVPQCPFVQALAKRNPDWSDVIVT